MVVRVIEAKEDKVTMADLIADLKKAIKSIIPVQYSHSKGLCAEKKRT